MRALFDYQNPEAVRNWLGYDEGKLLLRDLAELREQKIKSLKNATELLAIGRLQGSIDVLDRILSLREELANALVPKGRS